MEEKFATPSMSAIWERGARREYAELRDWFARCADVPGRMRDKRYFRSMARGSDTRQARRHYEGLAARCGAAVSLSRHWQARFMRYVAQERYDKASVVIDVMARVSRDLECWRHVPFLMPQKSV